MTLGEKIKIFGQKQFGSVTGLAGALGMSMQTLSHYVNDHSLPGTKILQKLLNLGCDLNWLLGDQQGIVKESGLKYGRKSYEDVVKERDELASRLMAISKIIEGKSDTD